MMLILVIDSKPLYDTVMNKGTEYWLKLGYMCIRKWELRHIFMWYGGWEIGHIIRLALDIVTGISYMYDGNSAHNVW